MPQIKICGLFRNQDIEYVNEAKPGFIGFVFAEKSRRFVSAAQAENLRKNLAEGITPVGVFVNAKIDDIVSLHKNGVIDMVQLHGGESDEYIAELRSKCGAAVIRALNFDKLRLENILNSQLYSYVLLDSSTPGSGQAFDWGLLKGVDLSNVFLAGGINLENVAVALKLNPFALDVSSGAETDGVKDREKIFKISQSCNQYLRRF
ncbi:MAG: phosphoribosylanthranilate isomerase [Fibromonadaceae bacterium]|jgi:phosphoribosylanthranilate isomerase|nr:phosphoribosylanthranilate isomerase [Fibromonadaceae bacterium]